MRLTGLTGGSGRGDLGGKLGAEGALDDVGDDSGAGGAFEVGDGVEVLEELEVVGGDGGGAEGDFAARRDRGFGGGHGVDGVGLRFRVRE